jgi:hypothetical protein
VCTVQYASTLSGTGTGTGTGITSKYIKEEPILSKVRSVARSGALEHVAAVGGLLQINSVTSSSSPAIVT